MRQQSEMKNSMLSQILNQNARARRKQSRTHPCFIFLSKFDIINIHPFSVSTLQAAKPDKAKQVEAMLISMAQRGQIQGQLGEEQLKSILEQISNTKSQSTVSVSATNITFVTMNPRLDVKTNIFF